MLLVAGTAHGDLYKVFEPMSFHKASDKCRDQGGNIPLPLDEKENQNLADFLNKNKLSSAWLSVSNSHAGYFSMQDDWSAPDYMNWEHERPRNGPFVGLAKAFNEDEEAPIPNKMAIIGEQTSWYDQPTTAKNSFICMKKANMPGQEESTFSPFPNNGLRPMIFIGPPLPNENLDEDKEFCGGKDWRYAFWDNDICWKFIKEQMSFPKAWAKCKGMGGYIPCPRDNWANNQLNEFIREYYTTIDEETGEENVNEAKLKSIKMIWLGIKKTGDKWLCKDPEQNLNGYEGFLQERPIVKYVDDYNKGTRVDFKKNNIYHGNGTIEYDVMAFVTRSVMNPSDGKWKWAMNEQIFDTVCEFKKEVTADEEFHQDLIDGQGPDANGAIFIPKGEFDFYQAQQACANQGAKMYAPETKLQRFATMVWFQKFIADEQAKINAHWAGGFNNRMPAHFGGPAPTMEPTLYDEDLPWLGFHFDTEQVMFKKIEEDDSGPPGPPSRMAPRIKFTEINKKSNWKDFTASPEAKDESTFCCRWPWDKPAVYPRYDMYASLRFKQSYQWYTNSGDEDRGMIHDNLFWMSTNKIIEMKVLCEQFDPNPAIQPSDFSNFMIPEKPVKPVVCDGVEGFEEVQIGDNEWICLHFNMKDPFEWDQAKKYCETIDPYKTDTGPRGRMWYPHSEEEQKRVGRWLVSKMKEGDIQHKIDQCANSKSHCWAQAGFRIYLHAKHLITFEALI